MTARPDTEDYRALFLADTPLVDLRAPAEFARGAFPGARSLPLMTDAERAEVGTCYKREGQLAAIELGHRLVSGELRAERLAAWLDFARRHPDGYLYCFRGGLRSQTVQAWLRDAGLDYPLVLGGYKAMRRFLLEELERSLQRAELVLVAGKTGTGKTRVVQALPDNSVDLEGLARHRGSSFGALPEPQPSQIDFENAFSIALLRLLNRGVGRVYLEDEGRLIGRLSLPPALREKMAKAPLVVVEQSLAERVRVVLEDYIVDLGRRYREAYGEEGGQLHEDKLVADLGRIRRRLGGERHARVECAMREAFRQQRQGAGPEVHGGWIETLLEEYYDPMYEYQLQQRDGRRLFSGDRRQVVDWVVRHG